MNHIKHILLALICAIVTAPVAAKGACTQSELDSVTDMSRLQKRLFNAGGLSGINVLLYLQPLADNKDRALVKAAMRRAANKMNGAYGVQIISLVGDSAFGFDADAEKTTIVVPIRLAHSSTLEHHYPGLDWSVVMGYASLDAIVIATDNVIRTAEGYGMDWADMMQSVILHELAHHFRLEHWFEYGDKEDVCLMGEGDKDSPRRTCYPLDFCAAEKAAIRAAQ